MYKQIASSIGPIAGGVLIYASVEQGEKQLNAEAEALTIINDRRMTNQCHVTTSRTGLSALNPLLTRWINLQLPAHLLPSLKP